MVANMLTLRLQLLEVFRMHFFPVVADLALRLGPDSERSGKKCTK